MVNQRVTFANVSRARPFVLTRFEVRFLSRSAGRDVAADLPALTAERFEAMTMGQLLRLLVDRLGTK